MSELKTNIISRKKRILLILLALCCVLLSVSSVVYINKKKQVENHALWIKSKQPEFEKILSEAQDVMLGRKKVEEKNPLCRYNITNYANYENAYNIKATIDIIDIEEVKIDEKYIIHVMYTQELYNEDGKIMAGSWDVDSYWTVQKKQTGEWKIIDIQELA